MPRRRVPANAIVFNTCAVTAEATRQARQAIRKARAENPDAEIIVTGCAAQTEPEMFAAHAGSLARARQRGEAEGGKLAARRQCARLRLRHHGGEDRDARI